MATVTRTVYTTGYSMSGSKASDASTAAALKDQGNVKYQSQQYKEAVDLYSHAIELDPNNAALYRQAHAT